MKYLKTLLKLKRFKTLNFSQVPKTLADELLKEGLVEIRHITAKKKKIIATDYFFYRYKDLEKIEKADSRGKLTKVADSKAKKISPQSGLFISGNCRVNDKKIDIFQDSAIFLKELPDVEKEALVVVVENFENLIYFKKQLYLFAEKSVLFVFRNKAMLDFIKGIDNKIVYFGDFDLAGVSIYLKEILPIDENIKFFIPKTIEEDISRYGSKKLFDKQINRYKTLQTDIKNIDNLIGLIKKYQKALEQEFYIKD